MKMINKNPFVKEKCSVVVLSLVCTLLFAAVGCKENVESKINDDTSLRNLETAPVSIVPKEDLPEWIQDMIEYHWESYVLKPCHKTKFEIFRGEWKKRIIYYVWHSFSSNNVLFYYEDGKRVENELDAIMSESKKWELIYQIENGIVTEMSTKSAYSKAIKDKYEFPDISGMNDWWGDPDIIQKRLDALQIPDAVLASISTGGLLETCLEFPYLIDIHFGNHYQQGFDGLLMKFNGFRVLLERRDLTDALIEKYLWFSEDVKNVRALSLVEQGRFALRHFVLELMLAQDVVIDNLSENQEDALFSLSLERAKIKKRYPDIFANYHDVPPALLYAKKIMKDNIAPANMKDALMEFIQVPLSVEQNVMNFLNEYANAKSK